MKGKIKETVNKWWVLVVVAALALSLTSCGKRRTTLMGGGLSCTGELGEFTVAIEPSGNGLYSLLWVPDDAPEGEYDFYLPSIGGVKKIRTLQVADVSEVWELANLSKADLANFPTLIMSVVSFDGVDLGQQECEIPY